MMSSRRIACNEPLASGQGVNATFEASGKLVQITRAAHAQSYDRLHQRERVLQTMVELTRNETLLLLGRFLRGDIGHHAHHPLDLAGSHKPRLVAHPAPSAVRAAHTARKCADAPAASPRRPDPPSCGLPVKVLSPCLRISLQGVSREGPDALIGRADVDDPLVVQVEYPEHVVNGIGEQAKSMLDFRQRVLPLLAAGDVPQ